MTRKHGQKNGEGRPESGAQSREHSSHVVVVGVQVRVVSLYIGMKGKEQSIERKAGVKVMLQMRKWQ